MDLDGSKLQDAGVFRGLADLEIHRVLSAGDRCCVRRGAVLFEQGDDPSRLFAVAVSRFKMTTVTTRRRAGSVATCGARRPHGLRGRFPWISLSRDRRRGQSCAVLVSSEFESIMRQRAQLATNTLAIMGGNAHHMLQRLREVSTTPVERCLAHALLRAMPSHGEVNGEPGLATLRLSRQDLAELSATTVYAASRIVSRWARAQILLSARSRIVVRDRERLRQIAQG